MQAVRRRDTAPEIAVRRLLHAAGLRYFVDRQAIPGLRRRADILFPRARVAVFVDGCFWHSCPEHGSVPVANHEWWRVKLERTRLRDRETDDRLRGAGWTVLRLWEHEDAIVSVERVMSAVLHNKEGRAEEGSACP